MITKRDPVTGKILPIPMVDKFWSKVRKTKSCWLWIGATNHCGYGMLHDSLTRKLIRAHRISWQLHNGAIPGDLKVLHHCDNPPCVNPKHLHLGTPADNHADRVAHGKRLHGENNGMASITEETARKILGMYVKRPRGCPKGGRHMGFYAGSIKGIAQTLGVSHVIVGKIIRHERWKHI